MPDLYFGKISAQYPEQHEENFYSAGAEGNTLAQLQPDEVNFWQPGGNISFKAVPEYGLFLFKLHSPYNFIVGGGFFGSVNIFSHIHKRDLKWHLRYRF